MALPQMGTNSAARRKWVYFEGTDTIYEGMPVCYNFDTTDNILGWSGSAASGTTAEGGQNEGKFMRVELPTATNLQFFAGVVAGTAKAGLAGPCWLDIYEANGAIVPVRTNVSCTVGVTALAIKAATAYFTNPIYGGSTASAVLMALANETVDRSSTTGLVLAKLGNVGIVQGHGASSNQLVIGSGVTTEVELIPNFMSYKSLQTDGSFDVLRIRGEIAGAGGSCPLGVLRAEAVINSASQGTPKGCGSRRPSVPTSSSRRVPPPQAWPLPWMCAWKIRTQRPALCRRLSCMRSRVACSAIPTPRRFWPTCTSPVMAPPIRVTGLWPRI